MREMRKAAFVAVSAIVVSAAPAFAATVLIDPIGGGVLMDSKDLSGFVFGGPGTPVFPNASLKLIHDDINIGSSIPTNGLVTFILAETDAGLAFMGLIDDETGVGFAGFNSIVGMSTTSVDSTNVEFINDSGSDISTVISGLDKIATGDFKWDSATRGDAFAWAGLTAGDVLNFGFSEIVTGDAAAVDSDTSNGIELTANGLSGPKLFQFLSWSTVTSSWSIVATGDFTGAQQFGFTATVIPLPTSAGLAAVGMLAIAGIRRRRTV